MAVVIITLLYVVFFLNQVIQKQVKIIDLGQ